MVRAAREIGLKTKILGGGMETEAFLWPEKVRSGQIIYPYTDAQH